MNKLKESILRTLKSLPRRVVYDPSPTKQKQKQKEKEKEKQKQQEEDDADDLFFFDAPPSPDSILNPKPHPDDDDDGDGGHHRTLDASYVLVHLPDASQPIAADAAQPNPNRNSNSNDGDDREEEEEEEEEEEDLLREFEVRCPPGGEEAVIVYTTSLRGIRKTFEDCGRVRLLLRGLRAAFHERDVSMHSGYRDELWAVQGRGAAPPRVFVKGRYVGGAEELIALHEQGKLLPLLRRCGGGGGGGLCAGCGGASFVVCARCSGSCKVYDEERGVAIRCAICNENGLVACPLCL